MPALMLLRHAKSDWKADYLYDRERPLNRRGVRSARAVGRFVADYRLVPDLVLTSPAVRAATTADLAASAGEWDTEIVRVPTIYGADPAALLHLVRAITDVERLMVVGHEPTMSGFLGSTTGSHLRVTTAALASLRLTYGRWADAAWGTAELELFVRPRLLLKAPR